MLKFLKKSGRTNNDEKISMDKTKRHSMPLNMQIDDNTPLDDHLEDSELNESLKSRSRLSMNLLEIISDKTCLSYFIQFLETKNALSLIKFYLDAENFKTVTEKEISSKENNNFMVSHRRKPTKSTSSDASDKLSINSSNFDLSDAMSLGSQLTNVTLQRDEISTNSNMSLEEQDEEDEEKYVEEDLSTISSTKNKFVPELKTLCDLSMRKPLTDDEKSMLISAESNKNFVLKSCSANNFDVRKPKQYDNKEIKLNINKAYPSIATDAFRIYRKYLITNSQYFIDIPITILSTISLQFCALPNSNDDDEILTTSSVKTISSDCFVEAQKHIFERLESEHLNEFLDSSYYCKYIVDILSNEIDLKLSDILHSEAALFYFMEYLEQENQRDLLEFWMTAMNFRKHYLNSDIDDANINIMNLAQNDAMILYEKYFSLQAACPLKISDKIRSEVEEKICCDDENIFKCFDLPLRIIEKFIENKYFSNFLSSQLFANYLNDLKSKIQDHKSPEWKSSMRRKSSNNRHRKTLSDCSSDSTNDIRKNFISQQNTLLAMESTKIKTNKSADMQIDSRQLNDPDMLWKRNSRGGLTFGRVNSLGRYERDFELGTTEEKWTLATGSNKLKNAMRKFVNLPEDKVQEEIAWQVAEMIVKDVTSITLGNNEEISE